MSCPFTQQPVSRGLPRNQELFSVGFRRAGAKTTRLKKKKPIKSLYERLGGIFAIAAVVDHFSDAILRNPKVGVGSPNAFLDNWSRNEAPSRLPGLKWMRTLWVAAISGGPFKFHPSEAARFGKCPFSLENAHKQLQVSPAEFDEVARILARSLDHFGVKAREKREVIAAFAAHKPDVSNGFFLSHHRQPPTFSC